MTFHVILMWCAHDLPKYNLLSSQITKGYNGCLVCGPSTYSQHSKFIGKKIHHTTWLKPNHPLR